MIDVFLGRSSYKERAGLFVKQMTHELSEKESVNLVAELCFGEKIEISTYADLHALGLRVHENLFQKLVDAEHGPKPTRPELFDTDAFAEKIFTRDDTKLPPSPPPVRVTKPNSELLYGQVEILNRVVQIKKNLVDILFRPNLPKRCKETITVSYTHLTLPTNREV